MKRTFSKEFKIKACELVLKKESNTKSPKNQWLTNEKTRPPIQSVVLSL